MVEDIDIFNVRFGDCFILEDNFDAQNSNKMLVDFGSTRRINQPVISLVNNSLAMARSKYLMVTHFHGDHYSGIRTLNNNIIFDEVYLPDFFSRGIVKLQFTLLSVLSESHPAYQIAYNMLSVIPNIFRHLDRNNTKIIFVKRGDRIYNNLDSFRILWPKADDFEIQAQELFREVIGYYNLGEDYQNVIERLTERYLSAFPETREDEGNGRVLRFEGYELREERIRQIEADIEYVTNRLGRPRKGVKNSLSKKISSCQNQICICFDNVHERNVQENRCVLFLSDIHPTQLQTIIKSEDDHRLELLWHYNAIKVPHHGTRDYFADNLPSSIHMIVPNGYAQDSSWAITELYGSSYNDRIFICANYYACRYSFLFNQCAACRKNHCICGFYPHYLLNL